MKLTHLCPSCSASIEVECIPGVEGRYYGPPELCYPSEEPDIDPRECPECKAKLDVDKILEVANEEAEMYAVPDED